MIELVAVLVGLLVVSLLAMGGLAGVRALRWERERQRVQAERLATEARLQLLTHSAMQQLHAVARQALQRQERQQG